MNTNTATAPTVTETIRANTATEFHADYAFGVVDSKGRALGCAVSVNFCEARDESAWRNATPARFEFRPYSLRGGETFGAIPVRAWKNFDTLAAAHKHAAKYVASAAKRAAKVAAADAAKPAAAAARLAAWHADRAAAAPVAAAPVAAAPVAVEPVVDSSTVARAFAVVDSLDQVERAREFVRTADDATVRSLAAFAPHVEDDSDEAAQSNAARRAIESGARPAIEREYGFAAGNFDGAYNFDPSDGRTATRHIGGAIHERSNAYALGYIAGAYSSFETHEVPGACALVVRSIRAGHEENSLLALDSFRRVVAEFTTRAPGMRGALGYSVAAIGGRS